MSSSRAGHEEKNARLLMARWPNILRFHYELHKRLPSRRSWIDRNEKNMQDEKTLVWRLKPCGQTPAQLTCAKWIGMNGCGLHLAALRNVEDHRTPFLRKGACIK